MRFGSEVLNVDLYEVLKVQDSASAEEIRRAYRRQVARSHPDLNRHETAERETARLNVAAGVLLDPVRRAAYDRHRHHQRRAQHRSREEARVLGGPASGPAEWVRPPRPQRQRLSGELRALLKTIHPWPARPLSELDGKLRRWPPRRHGVVLAVAAVIAFGLIAQSRPRSIAFLCGPNCRPQPISAAHLSPGFGSSHGSDRIRPATLPNRTPALGLAEFSHMPLSSET